MNTHQLHAATEEGSDPDSSSLPIVCLDLPSRQTLGGATVHKQSDAIRFYTARSGDAHWAPGRIQHGALVARWRNPGLYGQGAAPLVTL
ncbi:MAG TPA: hypothetical protein VNK95_08795 [Caldilineaceae bacterium]|nr:hypothetical protein [Caldilineaceae bacterium]